MLSFFLSGLAKVLFEMQLKTTIWPNYTLVLSAVANIKTKPIPLAAAQFD
jgi:hypothetical protein